MDRSISELDYVTGELLAAMDSYKTIARQLIYKLISETDQPEIEKVKNGEYDLIENAALFNRQENLSDNWYFDVHGEHCLFKNVITGQTLEVSLGGNESIDNLDPYFFFNFLKTTDHLKHLTGYFQNPFSDMLSLFEELEKQKIMQHIYRTEYRKN